MRARGNTYSLKRDSVLSSIGRYSTMAGLWAKGAREPSLTAGLAVLGPRLSLRRAVVISLMTPFTFTRALPDVQ